MIITDEFVLCPESTGNQVVAARAIADFATPPSFLCVSRVSIRQQEWCRGGGGGRRVIGGQTERRRHGGVYAQPRV